MALRPAARHDLLVAGLALAVCVVLFPGALVRGEAFFERDLNFDWYLRLEAVARAVRSGGLPLWDTGTGFGQPLLADPGTQVLYPTTWLGLALPRATGYTAFVVLHLVLTAVGGSRLARSLGAGPVGASVAALLWTLSGPMQSAVNLRQHFAGAAWMPWVLLAAHRAARSPGPGSALALTAALVAQILAGSADVCAMTWALVVSGVTLRWAGERRRRRRRRATVRGALACAAAAGLAAGLTAIVWWPAVDVLSRSPRRDLPEEIRAAYSVPPAGLLRLAVPLDPARVPPDDGSWPNLYGGSQPPFLASLYLGVVALAVVGASLAWKRLRWRAALLLAGSAGALAAAMGPQGPVYPLLMALVPPLRIFRYPSKLTLVAALLVALAVGLGLQALRRGRIGPRASSRFAGLLLAAALGSVLVSHHYGPNDASSLAALLAVTAAAVLALAAWGRVRPGLAAAVVGALAVVDLVGAHAQLNPTAQPMLLLDPPPLVAQVDRGEGQRLYVYDYHSLPGTAERLLGRPGPYSYVTPPPGWDRRVFIMVALRLYLVPPFAGLYGLEGSYDFDIRGLYPVYLNDLTFFLRRTEGLPAQSKLLRMGAVGTVASLHDGGFGDPVATLVSLFPEPIRVWRVRRPLPRSWVVGCARQADEAPAFAALLDPGFDPAGEVILSEPPPPGSVCGPAGTSRFLAPRPDRVRLEVEAERPGFVVLADAYDPGWRASIDGREAPVRRANVAFRAVAVPAGRHVVEMVYRPRALSFGLALTLLTLALVAVATATRALPSRGARSR
jgi:hypothetical protein